MKESFVEINNAELLELTFFVGARKIFCPRAHELSLALGQNKLWMAGKFKYWPFDSLNTWKLLFRLCIQEIMPQEKKKRHIWRVIVCSCQNCPERAENLGARAEKFCSNAISIIKSKLDIIWKIESISQL